VSDALAGVSDDDAVNGWIVKPLADQLAGGNQYPTRAGHEFVE
jgi:hypothetical protein